MLNNANFNIWISAFLFLLFLCYYDGMKINLSLLTIITLLVGSIFSLTTVVIDFRRFFAYGGDWFIFSGTMFPHPATTACFYGAFAFLGAFIFAVWILKIEDARKYAWYVYLVSFLIAGNLFAWTNTGLLFYRFYTASPGEGVSCSGVPITNPFTTPCFIGALLFLLSLIVGIITLFYYRYKIQKDNMLPIDKKAV